MAEASEKQLDLLKKLTHVDYTGKGLTLQEANDKIKVALDKGKALPVEKPPVPSNTELPRQIESPERQNSIEAQNAYTGVPALLDARVKYPDDPLGQTAYNYAMSKLDKWASMGESVKLTVGVKKIIEEKVNINNILKDLTAVINSGKMSKEGMREALEARGGKGKNAKEMIESLPPESIANFALTVKQMIPSRLVEEAIKLGATEEKEG